MAASTLQSLATAAGLRQLNNSVGRVDSFFQEGPEKLDQVKTLLEREFERDPRLKDIQVESGPGSLGYYHPGKDLIHVGVVNPAVLAHEIGHAKNVRYSKFYKYLLGLSGLTSKVNTTLAIPATLAIRALVKDPDTRNEVFNTLSAFSAMASAPVIAEELSASVDAVKNAPDRLQALKSLMPAFLTYVASSAIPIGIYQVGKQTE